MALITRNARDVRRIVNLEVVIVLALVWALCVLHLVSSSTWKGGLADRPAGRPDHSNFV